MITTFEMMNKFIDFHLTHNIPSPLFIFGTKETLKPTIDWLKEGGERYYKDQPVYFETVNGVNGGAAFGKGTNSNGLSKGRAAGTYMYGNFRIYLIDLENCKYDESESLLRAED